MAFRQSMPGWNPDPHGIQTILRAAEIEVCLRRAGDVNPLIVGLSKNQGTNVPRSPLEFLKSTPLDPEPAILLPFVEKRQGGSDLDLYHRFSQTPEIADPTGFYLRDLWERHSFNDEP